MVRQRNDQKPESIQRNDDCRYRGSAPRSLECRPFPDDRKVFSSGSCRRAIRWFLPHALATGWRRNRQDVADGEHQHGFQDRFCLDRVKRQHRCDGPAMVALVVQLLQRTRNTPFPQNGVNAPGCWHSGRWRCEPLRSQAWDGPKGVRFLEGHPAILMKGRPNQKIHGTASPPVIFDVRGAANSELPGPTTGRSRGAPEKK